MRRVLTILFIGLITMQFVACTLTSIGNNGMPEWVHNPRVEGYITSLGVANPNKGDDIALQRSEAMAVARDDMARQIETKIGSLVDKFAESTGSGENESYARDVKIKIRNVAKMKLRGSRPQKSWMSPSGKLYLLMTLETKEVINILKQSVDNQNDKEIKFQRFLSEKNQKELERELENYEK